MIPVPQQEPWKQQAKMAGMSSPRIANKRQQKLNICSRSHGVSWQAEGLGFTVLQKNPRAVSGQLATSRPAPEQGWERLPWREKGLRDPGVSPEAPKQTVKGPFSGQEEC